MCGLDDREYDRGHRADPEYRPAGDRSGVVIPRPGIGSRRLRFVVVPAIGHGHR